MATAIADNAASVVDHGEAAAGNNVRGDGAPPPASGAEHLPYTFTRIQATKPEEPAKGYALDDDGNVVPQPGGSLVRGTAEVVTVNDAREFVELLSQLSTKDLLTYGAPTVGDTRVAARDGCRHDEVPRDRHHWDWRDKPGILMVDYDPKPGATPYTPDELLDEIYAAAPGLRGAPVVVAHSASSWLYNAETGEQLKGARGLRLYFFVADARDIPRAGAALHERLWLCGHGRYDISKSGQLLDRTIADASVWQAERVDYASGARCGPGVEQRRPDPVAYNPDADPLDTMVALPDLTAAERERVVELREQAAAAVQDERERKRREWVEHRLAEQGADDDGQARQTLRDAIEHQRLGPDFVLHMQSGAHVTVEHVLRNADTYHATLCADPLEPDYRGDGRIAFINLRGARPTIYSHAHGGQRFELTRTVATAYVVRGQMPRVVDDVLCAIGADGRLYQRDGQLVRVLDDGTVDPVDHAWLLNYCEKIVAFYRWDKRAGRGRNGAWVPSDAPGDLSRRILSQRGAWPVPELRGVVHGPTMRLDGSLLTRPGYDPDSGLLLLADHPDGWPTIPSEPTREQVAAALRTLWEPVELFPFGTALDRGVCLAAQLTAVLREQLPTAPGFVLRGSRPGVGKGFLAKTIAWLTGSPATESPWPAGADEQRKRLMSKLIANQSCMLIDNVNHELFSDELCAVLTAEHYEDRRLGVTGMATAPTNMLVLATGNALRLGGDLSRRMLPCTIDPQTETPEKRDFPFHPPSRARENWLRYRVAALTVLRAYVAAGWPRCGQGTTGSFETWDTLVRQAVCWTRDSGLAPVDLDDPRDAISNNFAEDPETRQHRELMTAWREHFGPKPVSTRELAEALAPDQGGLEARTDLADALLAIAGERGHDTVNRRSLGRWIDNHEGRISAGMRIVESGSNAKRKRWMVDVVGDDVRDAA